MSLLEDARTVLLLHAHPDDEVVSTGALVAELVARGIRTELLTATGGERGEVVPGSADAAEGSPELIAVRAAELACARAVLGFADSHRLGVAPARATGLPERAYRDSGMRWLRPGVVGPATDIGADALVSAPFDEVVAEITALLGVVRPDLVISYDEVGGYGHPDHLRLRQAGHAAATRAGIGFAEILDDRPAPDRPSDAEWFDLPQHEDLVVRALRCHATQLTVDGAEIVHVGGQRQSLPLSFGLRRA